MARRKKDLTKDRAFRLLRSEFFSLHKGDPFSPRFMELWEHVERNFPEVAQAAFDRSQLDFIQWMREELVQVGRELRPALSEMSRLRSVRTLGEIYGRIVPTLEDAIRRAHQPATLEELTVEGDSMIDRGIFPGEKVLYAKNDKWVANESLVCEVRGEVLIKEVLLRDGRAVLRCHNREKDYPDYVIQDGDAFKIHGVVVYATKPKTTTNSNGG